MLKTKSKKPLKKRSCSPSLSCRQIHTNNHILASQHLHQAESKRCWNCAKHCTHLRAVQKDLMKNVSVTVQKKPEHRSLISNHSKLTNRGELNEEGCSSATSPGLIVLSRIMEEGHCWKVTHHYLLSCSPCWVPCCKEEPVGSSGQSCCSSAECRGSWSP